MQRQSLGSPGSKLHPSIHGGAGDDVVFVNADDRQKSPDSAAVAAEADAEEIKLEKPRRSHSAMPEKFIHLIPILIFLCLLVLFLCSHDPTPNDMAHFDRFRHSSEVTADSTDIDELGRFHNKGEAIAIRSLRNLQEIGKIATQKSRSHRKLADF